MLHTYTHTHLEKLEANVILEIYPLKHWHRVLSQSVHSKLQILRLHWAKHPTCFCPDSVFWVAVGKVLVFLFNVGNDTSLSKMIWRIEWEGYMRPLCSLCSLWGDAMNIYSSSVSLSFLFFFSHSENGVQYLMHAGQTLPQSYSLSPWTLSLWRTSPMVEWMVPPSDRHTATNGRQQRV
jgi:hypothetical protein